VIEAGLIAMLRVITALAGSTYLWGPVLVGFGCINMLVGNLMALRQNEVKRLLAYSSIAQMGYMLVGFGFSIWFGHADSSFGAFFHLLNHAFMKGLAFMAAGALIYALYLTKGKHGTLVLDDLNGAAKRYPLVVFAFSIGLLALGGLPPLSGFMSKTSIFVAAAETGSWFGTGVVIFGSLNAILSLAYYAPMVNRMYRLKPSEAVLAGGKVSAMMVIPLVILVGLIVVIGFWPAAINWIVIPAAKAFTLPFSPYGF
jgi:formate hydrogenlyase subunit 3/multisubunit Na+/H+ antiporter MnhD subunit